MLVVICGLVENTTVFVPVSFVKAAAKFALEGVAKNAATFAPRPDIPVLTGRPVQLVKVPALGVPMFGVTSVGLLENTTVLVPVSSVSAAAKFALVGVAKNVATFVPRPEIPVLTGSPVQLVKVPALGVPIFGVTSVGLVANTSEPVPVSSEITPRSSSDVVAANALSLLPVSAMVPVASGSAIVREAVNTSVVSVAVYVPLPPARGKIEIPSHAGPPTHR